MQRSCAEPPKEDPGLADVMQAALRGPAPAPESPTEGESAILHVVDVDPSPVTVFVDGDELGVVPGQVEIPAEKPVTIQLKSAGHDSWDTTLELPAGEMETIREVELEPKFARMVVEANVHGADIVVDGDVVGQTRMNDPVEVDVQPGDHHIQLRLAGCEDHQQSRSLAPGTRTDLEIEMSPEGESTEDEIVSESPVDEREIEMCNQEVTRTSEHHGWGADVDEEDEQTFSSLSIFNRAVLQIEENYVEPSEVVPHELLVHALYCLQFSTEKLDVEFDGKPESTPRRVEIIFDGEKREFNISPDDVESKWEASLRLKEVFMFVEQHIDSTQIQKYGALEYAAIEGGLASLDSHSGILLPKEYEEMQAQAGGEFGSIGMVIGVRDGVPVVISSIDGTPAAEAGIGSGAQLVKIDGYDVRGESLNTAVSQLRGGPGTEVEIAFRPPGEERVEHVQLTRDVIEIDSVEGELLEGDVGYVRVNNFQANTVTDFDEQLRSLERRAGGLNLVVLDLRSNPGGLLEKSVDLADRFLSSGTIVTTRGAGGTREETEHASAEVAVEDTPVVVLIDEGTASASEIVAFALEENERAVVVGDKPTFGKGTVQILYEFPDDSALRLTIAQYFSPDDNRLEDGLEPTMNWEEFQRSNRQEARVLRPILDEIKAKLPEW